jgi:hypothetical protein
MTKDEMFAAIVAQRGRLADTLDGLTDAEWNTPSLCAGWRIRDVVGGRARGFVPSGRTKGLRFEATDSTWSIGSGAVVTGTAEALTLAATGRGSVLSELSGPGAAVLAERLG